MHRTTSICLAIFGNISFDHTNFCLLTKECVLKRIPSSSILSIEPEGAKKRNLLNLQFLFFVREELQGGVVNVFHLNFGQCSVDLLDELSGKNN